MAEEREITVDANVLVHCDFAGEEAASFRAESHAFVDHFFATPELVACVNHGILGEYLKKLKSGCAGEWQRHVVGQSRYRLKKRAITPARRQDFCKKRKVPLHGEDFDYVDAASQGNMQLWITHERKWFDTHCSRIEREFRITIQRAAVYLSGLTGDGLPGAEEAPCRDTD